MIGENNGKSVSGESMAGNILVAGVGNIFLGDDAFGVEVAQRLSRAVLPGNVRVVDYGIRSYDLAYALIKGWGLVILVDALSRGEAPGTVYTIEPEMPTDEESTGFDAHTMNPYSVLQMVSALGGKVGRMLVVGCEPINLGEDEGGQLGLSEPVLAAVDEAVRVVLELITCNSSAKAA